MRTRIAKYSAAVVAFVLLVLASPVAAGLSEQFNAARQGAGAEGQALDIRVVIARIISATFGLIGVVVVGFLVYAGWTYMTAGDSDRVDKAKTTIRNAIIGIAIVLLSYAIARFVADALLKATGT